MHQVILSINLTPAEATVPAVKSKLGLNDSQIDATFGVQPVRPESGEYAVRVDADVAQRERGEGTPRRAPQPGDVRVALVH